MSNEKTPYNLPGNSNKAKAEEAAKSDKKVERVTSGEVIARKKPLGRKIAETFAGDDAQSVGQYILFDVVIPAAKSMLSDAVSQGIERLLFGAGAPRSVPGRSGGRYTPYNKVSKDKSDGSRQLSQRARANHNFDEVVLESRPEATMVIEQLTALVDDYDVATVADLYELVGITGDFTDNKWGWFDLRGTTIRRVKEGYLIELPRVQPID